MARKKEAVIVEDKQNQDYELVFILSPELADEALEAKLEEINQFITSRDGVVTEVDRWGKRKLAYPVAHFLEGTYILARFQLSPAKCKELEASLKISEEVLRHLLIKVGS